MTPNSLQSHATACIIAAGTLFGLAPAQADVTLQGQETVGVGQAGPVSETVRLFLQGANARLETVGEPTLVYDGKGNILYGLDTARKSYYMTVPVEEEPTDSLPGGSAGTKEDVKLDLHETDQTLTLAGQLAHQYTVSGTVTFTRNQPEGGQRGGGRRRRGGGGGFPGQNGGFPGGGGENGGQGGRPGQSADFTPPQWSLSGEIWLADSVKFPSKENTVLAAQLAAASVGPFQQPLADELDKHHGLPLLARMTVTHTPASANGRQVNQYGGVSDSTAPRPVPTTTVTTFTVRAVSDAPLDPKLFRAPLEYALVAAPLIPYAPGQFSPAP